MSCQIEIGRRVLEGRFLYRFSLLALVAVSVLVLKREPAGKLSERTRRPGRDEAISGAGPSRTRGDWPTPVSANSRKRNFHV